MTLGRFTRLRLKPVDGFDIIALIGCNIVGFMIDGLFGLLAMNMIGIGFLMVIYVGFKIYDKRHASTKNAESQASGYQKGGGVEGRGN